MLKTGLLCKRFSRGADFEVKLAARAIGACQSHPLWRKGLYGSNQDCGVNVADSSYPAISSTIAHLPGK
jgi:hypothetical protein